MSQCKYTSAKKPKCRAAAMHGSDYCNMHKVRMGQITGLEGDRRPPPPPDGPASQESTLPPDTAEFFQETRAQGRQADRPSLGADRLLTGQKQRAEERQSYTAPIDTGEHKIEPEVIGARVAMLLHAAEMRSRQDFRERGAPRRSGDARYEGQRLDDGDPGPARPMRVLTRRQRPDPTRILDPITKRPPACLRPDWVQRWVSTVDWNDRPTEHRVAEYEDYGYEFVVDSENRPIEGRYGVAMQGPPENYAARMLDRTPTGAFQRDDSLQHADAIADIINRRQGDQVVRVVAERDHGQRFSEVPLGQEHLHDV